jgi:OmcA/MtrC family decaheme c-type cytochrome
VVDLAKCQACHQSLSLHGSNRTDNIYICVTCHNANATDINRREEAAEDAAEAGEVFEPADGKVEEAVHFKALIHGIHAGETREHPLVVYGFGGSETSFAEVVFPGTLSRCDTCHLEGTYYPDESGALLATTVSTGADRTTPLDDVNITPNAATCTSCHDDELAAAHVEQNGGAFDATQSADGTLISAAHGTVIETCAVCHGPGRLADVKVVHGF